MNNSNNQSSRRQFLASSGALVMGSLLQFDGDELEYFGSNRIIDIHQHQHYHSWTDEEMMIHQRNMGVSTTILLPAGTSVKRPSTHDGFSNGLEAKAGGNQACYDFAIQHPKEYRFGVNEVPDLEGAPEEIEKWLKKGAVVIGELKFGVDCDSIEMQKIYKLAEAYGVPVLMHWQTEKYNYGFDRFYKMLEQFPKVNFIGHAVTWWANIDKNNKDQLVHYPKGPVTAGGLTDRYLSDYPNMYGDLSAGSGLNAFTRDEEHGKQFLKKHEDKLLFGSDCADHSGFAKDGCTGAQQIAMIRKLSDCKKMERKILYKNAL